MQTPTRLWRPASEADLLRAAADGLLDEPASGLEFKQRLEEGRTANKRFAAELASLAVDGGRLVLGVVDPKHRDGQSPSNALEAQRLIERIESIARSIPDPPLPVSCTPLPSTADPDLGYVVVDVHPSIDAPHFVDGKPYV